MHKSQAYEANTFKRLSIEPHIIVANIGEGLCFRYGIPRRDKQLVTFFGGIACHDNYEAILNWVYQQIMSSESMDVKDLSDEIENKFSAKLADLY